MGLVVGYVGCGLWNVGCGQWVAGCEEINQKLIKNRPEKHRKSSKGDNISLKIVVWEVSAALGGGLGAILAPRGAPRE